MFRRSNPWPSFVDLFSALSMVAFGGLILIAAREKDLNRKFQELQRENTKLVEMNTRLQKEVDELRELRSRLRPSCVEKGIVSGPLFAVTIRGRDQYQISGGPPMSFEQILAEQRRALALALSSGCRHRVDVFYGVGVSGIEYDEALRRIRREFYVEMRGPRM